MNKKGYALLIILILVVIGQAAYTYNLTMKIDRLSNTVANLDADSTINNLDARIKTIEQELSNHDLSDIEELKDNVATNTSNITSINQYLDSINFKLIDIEDSISNLSLKSLVNWCMRNFIHILLCTITLQRGW